MIELAARDGVEAITVRKLTKRAGVSSRAFYARFSGIDDCLLTSYRDVMDGAARRIAGTRSNELGRAAQIEVALRAMLDELLIDRDVARFVLIEIYAGGPAALAAIAEGERRLELALRRCLGRRSSRVLKSTVAATVAATLRCARVRLLEAPPADGRQVTDTLVEWGRDVVEEIEELGIVTIPVTEPAPSLPVLETGPGTTGERDERDLLLAAVQRLVLPDGFHGLTAEKVSSAAGLPAVRFRRHFAGLADSYLALLRRTCRSFFIELTADGDPDPMPRVPIATALEGTWHRAASHPAAARLTFKQIVDAGVDGLTCREALISELAAAYSAAEKGQGAASSGPIRAESRAAALWAALAEAPHRHPGLTG